MNKVNYKNLIEMVLCIVSFIAMVVSGIIACKLGSINLVIVSFLNYMICAGTGKDIYDKIC